MTTKNGNSVAVRNGGVVVPSDPITLGNVLAASGFFTDSRDGAQAAVKVMAGQELGFGPIASMTGIYIVKGRVTLSANLMAAAIKRHPNYTFRVREHTATVCTIDFVEMGEVVGTSTFTMDDAKAAGLAGSETYKKFPKNMLYARALSNGAKWYCPDVFGGGPAYTPDELGAEVDGETGEMVNHEPVAVPVEAQVIEPPIPAEACAAIREIAAGLDLTEKLDLAVAHTGADSVEALTEAQALKVNEWLSKKADEAEAKASA
jgi:hypothetical protein